MSKDDSQRSHYASITAKATVSVSVTGIVTRNFALQHMKGSIYFAKRAEDIEKSGIEQGFGSWFDGFRHYFVATILLSSACIEALYSEIVVDCCLSRALLKERGRLVDRLKLLNKHLDGNPIQLGRPPGQHLRAIMKLRDSLVHPEPGSDVDPGKHKDVITEMEKVFHGKVCSPSFAGENTVLRYFTYRVSNWATRTCQLFAVELLEATNQKKKAEQFRSL